MRQPDPAALQQHAVVGVRRYRDRFQPALAQQRREQPPVFRFVLAVPADPPGEVAIRRQFGDPFILPTALRLPLRRDAEQEPVGSVVCSDFTENYSF